MQELLTTDGEAYLESKVLIRIIKRVGSRANDLRQSDIYDSKH